uniref:Germin-like protein n=1 Tax=Pseudococcomyxa simplex TaxID=464287 RepID=A0A7L9QE52_9CHLO|nr:putative extracellular protein CSOL_053 [Pseudococcomyxa simplex]
MMKLAIVLFLAVIGVSLASSDDGPITAKTIQKVGANAYVYNPLLLGTNGTQKSEGGSRQQRMLGQWPALAGQGVSQTVFTLEPCAMRPAHVHPRATGLLYLISGAKFMVGYVTEDGAPVNNEISTGTSALFPIGLVHYQQNLDCFDATYIISYNHEDPGTQMTYASLQQLPASAMAATLGVNTTGYETLLSASPKGVFIKSSDPDCVARCQLAPAKSGATVSAASVSG